MSTDDTAGTNGKTILLIHGAWLTSNSWDRFKAFYEAKGYTVLTPPWPYNDRPVETLQHEPAKGLAKLGLKELVAHYEPIIKALPEPPILIGHSFGGLIVQLLLDRGLGACGVAIDPVPPFGIPAHPQAVITSFAVFTAWNAWNRVLHMSFGGFKGGFANTLPRKDMDAAYRQYIVPTPGRIFFQAVLGIGAKINKKSAIRPPLLLIGAVHDKTVPYPMVKGTFKMQKHAKSMTDVHIFPNRSHWLCNEPGWKEVAGFAEAWAVKTLGASSTVTSFKGAPLSTSPVTVKA
jgi:pimeloyl-ACP methyl ester carboxylesterase